MFSQIVDNPAEVADKADRIITMLPSSPNVIDAYTGPNGILKYTLVYLNICTINELSQNLLTIKYVSQQKSEERLPTY